MRHVYLDHGATTPVHNEVTEAMIECLTSNWGNPSSLYSIGQKAKNSTSIARKQVADLIKANPNEIYFTSSGTEADNLALIGVVLANTTKKRHIITSAIEHHAILHTCSFLERNGILVTYLPVDKYGIVDPAVVEKALTENTILVSIMHANNEIGTIQPVKEISQLTKKRKAYFHVDAVQTFGKLPIDVNDLGVDLLSASAHKIYGPKGIGCLYIREDTDIHPIIFGGKQESNYRAGTENVAGIVGFGKAAQLAGQLLTSQSANIRTLGEKLEKVITSEIDDVVLNGHPTNRLPGHLNITFKNVESEALLFNLDMKGISVSTGAACNSGSMEGSHVLAALGLSQEAIRSSIRFTLGRENTEEDINYAVKELKIIINKLRLIMGR